MKLTLSDEQRLLRDSFARLFARESSIERVRAVAEAGFDPSLWASFAETGAPMARVPAERGGLSLSLLDATLIAEEAGRCLASIPLVEVMVAARLLACLPCDTGPWLDRIADGAIIVPSFAPAPTGIATVVPGGAVAEAVLMLDGDDLVIVSGPERRQKPENFGHLAVAAWRTSGDGRSAERIVLASGAEAHTAMERAETEWKLLSAAYLGSLTRQALSEASAYAKERLQFGRPIGSFQGLAHPLADAVSDVEGGQLLVLRAISAIAEGDADAAGLAQLSWWWAGQATIKGLRQAIRSLGGYGLSLEYDLHLYHRRGHAMVLLGGDPEHTLSRAGDLLFAGTVQALPEAGETGISFAPGESARRHTQHLREFFEANWNERLGAKAHHSSGSHDAAFHRALAEAGLIFGGWPREHGGMGHGPAEDFAASLVFEDWNYTSHIVTITNMIAQIVMRFGSEEAQAEILPRIKSGEAVCSLGFSEPSSGSDVFAARTSAVRDGEEWIVNGQKMFTTGAHYADYVLLLARNSADGAKHEGLTLFIVPTSLPGYALQPVETYQDERTNITFYSDMRVPDRYRLGEVGGGTAVMGAALTLEHGGANYFSGQTRMLRNALAWARGARPEGTRPIDDPRIRARLAKVRARVEVAACFVARGIAGTENGSAERYWGPMAKVFITESFLQNSWEVLEMGGPESILTGTHPLGMVELDHRRAYGTTIYGGTSEVHRSLVAEQALRLPKSRS